VAVKVKICGITNLSDALAAVAYGADALGFICAKTSPRFVTKDQIKQIISGLPPFVTTVGVFTEGTKDEIADTISYTGLSLIQLHGRFSSEIIDTFCHKAMQVVSLKNLDSHRARATLLDIGQNKIDSLDSDILFDVPSFPNTNMILAGGLTPENVQTVIAKVKPYAVDVCSGVEVSQGRNAVCGRKDPEKMRRFILNAKGVLG